MPPDRVSVTFLVGEAIASSSVITSFETVITGLTSEASIAALSSPPFAAAKEVNELLETIRAMQIIGVDTTQIKKQASTILKTLK